MPETSGEISRRLADQALNVCRRYLPNGKRVGNYWIAGDARGAKGRSLFVRVIGPPSGKGAAGKWSDAATGEHGDLLDLIAATCRFSDHREALDEARRFLNDARFYSSRADRRERRDSIKSAQRLFAAAEPIAGTLAEVYLKSRGILSVVGLQALRFHPRCFYRDAADTPPARWPALIAAVASDGGAISGVTRTYLSRDGASKAPLAAPRKALGSLAGNAVRFGAARDVLIVGEGIETVLSLRSVLPDMPLAAASSAQHLGMFRVPTTLRRLYIAADRDEAGLRAAKALQERAVDAGVSASRVMPRRKDFNDDLVIDGQAALAASLALQLDAQDRGAIRHIR